MLSNIKRKEICREFGFGFGLSADSKSTRAEEMKSSWSESFCDANMFTVVNGI